LTIHLPYAPTSADKLLIDGHDLGYQSDGNSIVVSLPNRLSGNLRWQLTRSGPLAQPVHFVSEHAGDGQVRLSWSDGGEGATYELQQCENWGPVSTSPLKNIKGTEATVSGLKNQTPYVFRLRAVTSRGAGEWSPEMISIPTAKGPVAPAGLEALDYYQGTFYAPPVLGAPGQAQEPAAVSVRWGQVRGAVSYTLERKEGQNDWKVLAADLPKGSFEDTTANGPVTYAYRVTAKNLNGPGEVSREAIVQRGERVGE